MSIAHLCLFLMWTSAFVRKSGLDFTRLADPNLNPCTRAVLAVSNFAASSSSSLSLIQIFFPFFFFRTETALRGKIIRE